MNDLGRAFRDWVAEREVAGATTTVVDDEHIRLSTGNATGQVNFYCFDDAPEVVELAVADDASGETTFFLHFELEDLDRAKELFDEMVSTLVGFEGQGTTHVLLCCTVGMTTSMFAAKLNEAAKTLSLDYEFEAKSLDDAKQGGSYAAVMLAPQVAFRRREVAAAFPNAVVTEIPAKIFGSYDAGGALRMLMDLLGDKTFQTQDPADLRLMRDIQNDKTLLLISVIHRPKLTTIEFRVYDRFKLKARHSVQKCKVTADDIVDVLATLHLHGVRVEDLDAVGIAMPGSVDYGRVRFSAHNTEDVNVEQLLARKFGVTVYVDNNANAGTAGCYVSSDAYDSVTLHTQQVGYLVGGQGTIANGHLLRGRRGAAGELGGLVSRLLCEGGPVGMDVPHLTAPELEHSMGDELAWSAERMLPVLAASLLANIAVVAPDAIYLSYDLIDDMDALRAELAKTLPQDAIPDLIHVTDYHEKIFAGEMALVLQRLRKAS